MSERRTKLDFHSPLHSNKTLFARINGLQCKRTASANKSHGAFRPRRFDYFAVLADNLRRLCAESHGNVAVVMGFVMIPLVGTLGLGFEVSNWYMVEHAMQNAADAAAIAASTNGGSTYGNEAAAVAAQYGFLNGSNNVTVTVTNAATCPSGGNTCYSVTITDTVPLYVSEVVGYKGNATLNSAPAQSLSAVAVATQGPTQVQLCLLALGKSGAQDIVTNGNPKANMANCSVMANTSATCHGANLGAPYGIAHGTDNGCGVKQVSGAPQVADPYSNVLSNDPNSSNALSKCQSSFPQEPAKKSDPALPAGNQWSGSGLPSGAISLGNNEYVMCGDVQLTGNVSLTNNSAATLIIENGQLDTNGYTLQTSSSSAGLSLVFSGGTNGGPYTHAPTGGGTLDIAAPTSGIWSGIAIYQDPNLTSGVNISAAGNSPTWDISGLVYLPDSTVTISGAVNKSSNGKSCFVMVMDQVTINGTGDILANTNGNQCGAAGLNMPQATVPGRGQLVL